MKKTTKTKLKQDINKFLSDITRRVMATRPGGLLGFIIKEGDKIIQYHTVSEPSLDRMLQVVDSEVDDITNYFGK